MQIIKKGHVKGLKNHYILLHIGRFFPIEFKKYELRFYVFNHWNHKRNHVTLIELYRLLYTASDGAVGHDDRLKVGSKR